LATKFNPLMMMKSMQESVRTLNPVIPVAGAWADVAQNVQTAGAEAMYDILGNRQGIEKMQQNYVPVTTGRFYQEPTTPLGKEFETGVTKAMDASKIPAVWPMALNQPIRPPITPNDVRVMGAEATRIGRQVKDIPTDFYNAQSGLQKLDPITGQPTYGAKLQGVADSVGDIMAQREMQGLPPIPGLPASMQPTNPKLYAMRPIGSRVTSATLPETAKPDAATYMPAQEIIRNVIDSPTMTPVQALDEIQNNILRKPEAASARRAFESFLKTKANEMYPDAPSEGAALAAYKARFGDREAAAAHSLEMYDQFLQTPNGIQYRAALDLPSAEELPAMHEAASNWLNSQFTNYLIEKVGTPNEPAAKLASQGLTFYPPSEIFDSADMSGSQIGAKRIAAGMPAKTPTDEALVAADQQLLELVQQAADAAARKREQETIAKQLGYGAVDPNTGVVPEGMNLGRYEPFAQASRESDKANAAYRKQQKVNDNLRLGSAYENATDKAIHAPFAKNLKEEIEYSERQFYPALMQTPDTERAYIANPVQLRNLGFEDLAKSFYSDVMSRKIKLDKVPKMTVEKYIRDTAEGRIAEEKLAQAKEKQFKTDADNQFARTASLYIPNDKVFGNVGALEITNRFTPEEVAKLVSEDTLALDVCIGEGGNVRDKPNPWHPGTGNRQYIPIYNIVTGQRDPDATSPRGAYINAVAQGSQMVSFRDTVTGEPIAIFDFNPSSSGNGKYDINFASGRKNGEVKPEYVEGIKSYLNSREDTIRGVSDKMNENLGIYDSKRMTNSALASIVNTPVSKFEKYDLSEMPRFVTSSDIRNYVNAAKANVPQESAPAILSQRPSESLEVSTAGAVASSIDNILDSQRLAFDEAGESNQFAQAEIFFRDTLDHFNRYLQAEGPVRALDRATQRLYDLENEYSNSPRIVANIIADGMLDLMQNLGLQAEYVNARIAAEGAQPHAVAMQGDPIPDNLDAIDIISRYRDRLSLAQEDWLRDFEERWNADVDDSPAGLGIHQVMVEEFARWRDANRLAPEGRPDYLRMTHDAALLADRQWGVQTADEVRAALRYISEGRGEIDGPLDPANDTDAYIRALRQQADAAVNGSAEIVLNELADEMESAYIRDWEPADEQPPARQAMQPFDWVGALDSLVNEVSQNTNPGIGNRVDTIAQRVAERTNPRLDPAGYAAALRAVDFTNEHVAVGPALRQLALAVEAAIVEQPPALRAADLDNQRNDRIFQLENAVNDPELNPEDLRFLANELSNPLNQAANNHWISLAENERRDYAQALRERANYIEFSPADFAIRLSNEAGANIPDLRDAVQALNDGTFDHEILRGLPAVERDRASQRTALYLNHILQGMQDGVPPAAETNLTQMPMTDLMSQITQMDNDTGGVWRRVNENTDFALRIARRQGADPATVGQAISQGAFVDPDTTPAEREYIARVIAQNLRDDAEYAARNQPPVDVTPAERNDAYEIATGLDDSYYQGADSPQQALAMVNYHISLLRDRPLGGYNAIVGLARDDYVYSPALIQALLVELELIRDAYRDRIADGNAEGGPVRGYKDGGMVTDNVPTPSLFSVSDYANYAAKDMYPGKVGIDDQRDAARHMLAAGTLSRKYGPKAAEFLGKAYEFKSSPLKHVKSLFGADMPPDYHMDTHNNKVGTKLGSQARTQSELEDLVQAEAERASKTKTPGQAFILKANGGIVQQNPTTDQMRYALTMRRK
jgi:Arc/MetJ family transcription regulator